MADKEIFWEGKLSMEPLRRPHQDTGYYGATRNLSQKRFLAVIWALPGDHSVAQAVLSADCRIFSSFMLFIFILNIFIVFKTGQDRLLQSKYAELMQRGNVV